MSLVPVTKFGAIGNGGTNCTAAFQATASAMKPGDIMQVPAGTWMLDALAGVLLKSNMTLQVDAGALVKAFTNTSDHYCLFNAVDLENLTVVGPGTIMGDADNHQLPKVVTSQWGFGIQLARAKNVSIKNIVLAKMYGDGIGINDFSQNITVDHVKFDSNYRCGISPCNQDGLVITNSTFLNGSAGIDCEPFVPSGVVKNTRIQFNSFAGISGIDIGIGSETPPAANFANIVVNNNQHTRKNMPLNITGNAGNNGTPPWAFVLNRLFYEGLHADWYRWWGYKTSWIKP